MRAKRSKHDATELTAQGSAFLMEMKAAQDEAVRAALPKLASAEREKLAVAEAEAELRSLKYERSRTAQGITSVKGPVAGATSDARARTGPEHQLELQRLAAEGDERRRRCDELERIRSTKRGLSAAMRGGVERCTAVDKELESITAVSSSMKEQLDAPAAANASPLVALLPGPLHTLHIACSAYLAARGVTAALSIEGDASAAEAAAEAAAGTDATAGSEYQPHPLHLLLTPGAGKGGAVCFLFYPSLGMIGVVGRGQKLERALQTLYPGDDGLRFPDKRCQLRAQLAAQRTAGAAGSAPGPAPTVSHILPARPYLWAQWLGGLGPGLGEGAGSVCPTQFVLDAICAAQQ